SPWSCVIPEISFRITLVLEVGKYFSKNLFLNSARSVVTSFGKVWYQSFAFPSKENGRVKALTASSSPPVLLVVAQITSKSLRFLIGSSPGYMWNRGSKLIRRLEFKIGNQLGVPGRLIFHCSACTAEPFQCKSRNISMMDVPESEEVENSRSKSESEEYEESFSDARDLVLTASKLTPFLPSVAFRDQQSRSSAHFNP
ncbi:hypothetical protein PIB30_101327, partial [Stylosanthes scabra]|nr:hypothetical protein [Stylosanthes scabra]